MDGQMTPNGSPTPVQAPAPGGFCSNCGTPVNAGDAVCYRCGAPLYDAPQPAPAGAPAPGPMPGPAAAPAAAPAKAKAKAKKPLPKKTLFIAAAAVAAAAVIALAAVFVLPRLLGGGRSVYALYLKDGEILYNDFSKDGEQEITSRLFNGSAPSGSNMLWSGYQLGQIITVSQDGRTIFYPDRSSSSVVLYCRSLAKPKEDPIKLDSDILRYAVNKAANRVTYLKSDGTLYQHNLKEKNKIASSVSAFFPSEDGSKVIYRTRENALYLWTVKSGDKEKIVSDIGTLQKVADDLSAVYYTRDNNLYRQAVGGDDKEKLASDISSMVHIWDSGEFYYIKSKQLEVPLMDFVDDDMAAQDANLESPGPMAMPAYPNPPESPSYPYSWNYSTWDEYYAAVDEYDAALARYNADYAAWESGPYARYLEDCERAQKEYNDAQEAWSQKNSRDRLRDYLKETTIDRTQYSLYYYDGKGDSLVTDALTYGGAYDYSIDAPVAVFQVYNSKGAPSLKLSDLGNYYYYYDIYSTVENSLYGQQTYAIASADSITAVETKNAGSLTMSSDGSAVYYLDNWSDDYSKAELYKVSVSNGTVGEPEAYDSGVASALLYPAENGSVLYFKNVSNLSGELYMDKNQVDDGVYANSLFMQDGMLCYYTEWNEKGYGTLNLCKDGSSEEVSDDVRSFYPLDNGDILYLYDFSSSSYTGTLCLYKSGKTQKLAKDVSAIIPASTSTSVRDCSNW